MSFGSGDYTPLDERQIVRIESLHRGFLYQHLFAVACLLCAQELGFTEVSVERDEDVELGRSNGRVYTQVKSRAAPLIWSDIESTVDRFADIRAEHASGNRKGTASFAIVSNSAPGPDLSARISGSDWPTDVEVLWPGEAVSYLPPPQVGVALAFQKCAELAARLPFVTLSAETLVWKLAGAVAAASAGSMSRPDHTFRAEELVGLFEQIVAELRDFPSPPVPYRVLESEPALQSEARVRLLTGLSGAGKTAWVSEAARHANGHVIYFDVVEMPGPSLASAMARELAARLFGRVEGALGQILLPGASGAEILGVVSKRAAASGERATIVLDNAHRAPPADLKALLLKAERFEFLLLAQPGANAAQLAADLSLVAEPLLGWSVDTVAEEVAAQDCKGDYQDCDRLIKLTAGMPLFVRNAVSIARAEYDGSIRSFCEALEQSAHTVETAQELILSKVVKGLPTRVQEALAVLSVADIPLERELVSTLVASVLNVDAKGVPAMLRTLRTHGLLETFPDDRLKLHDAIRLLGRGLLIESGDGRPVQAETRLRDLLAEAMRANRDFAKLGLYLRMLVALGDIKTLVQLVTDELFHELGFRSDLMEYLETAAASGTIDPEDRFWALDGLVFSEAKRGEFAKSGARLDLMDQLIAHHDLDEYARLAAAMKRMSVCAAHQDVDGVEEAMQRAAKLMPNNPKHQRIFRYNAARALWSLGRYQAAADESFKLIMEYYGVLGMTPKDVMGRNAPALSKLLKPGPDLTDDLKHLADSLDLRAISLTSLGDTLSLERIHAVKFYQLAHAPDSLVRVAQDLVDDFVERNDFIGAREMIETNILPNIAELKMVGRVIPVRSQYAVVLAYCGDFDAAEAEMARLAPYEAGLDEKGRTELRNQRALVQRLRLTGAPPQWQMPTLPKTAPKISKVGRNQPCPCGSGKKFKKCHG
jgi:hypothetical protein